MASNIPVVMDKEQKVVDTDGDHQHHLPSILIPDFPTENPLGGDTDSFHFRNDHIQGKQDPHKRRNHVAAFDTAKYKDVCAYEKTKGTKMGQLKKVSTPLEFKENAREYNGQTGTTQFLTTGKEEYKESNKKFLPEHLDGPISTTYKKTKTHLEQ